MRLNSVNILLSGLHKHIDLQIYLFESYEKSSSAYSAGRELKQEQNKTGKEFLPVLTGDTLDSIFLPLIKSWTCPGVCWVAGIG